MSYKTLLCNHLNWLGYQADNYIAAENLMVYLGFVSKPKFVVTLCSLSVITPNKSKFLYLALIERYRGPFLNPKSDQYFRRYWLMYLKLWLVTKYFNLT